MTIRLVIAAAILSSTPLFAQEFSIDPPRKVVRPGETVIFKLKQKDKDAPLPGTWKISSNISGAVVVPSDESTESPQLSFTAPSAVAPTVVYSGELTITATVKRETHTARLVLRGPADPRAGGDIVMAIIGFEQAGASSAQSDQKFFFDFFISRPLPWRQDTGDGDVFGPPVRWWGDVRIATYPQQITTSVADFAANFGQTLGEVKVNQLAQFGEFRTGLDLRIKGFGKAFFPKIGASRERSFFSIFASFGALGPFNAIGERVEVFAIPEAGTPQRAAFDRVFPADSHQDLALAKTKYIGLTIPDRDRFFRQYSAGFRLTTRFYDPAGEELPQPAMVAAAFGQHELVSGGQLRGVVGKFEGFYPLPLGTRDSGAPIFYLFGRANLRLSQGGERTPLVLKRALGSDGKIVPADDAGIAIIASASQRDLYTIGVGVDAVQIIDAIGKLRKKK